MSTSWKRFRDLGRGSSLLDGGRQRQVSRFQSNGLQPPDDGLNRPRSAQVIVFAFTGGAACGADTEEIGAVIAAATTPTANNDFIALPELMHLTDNPYLSDTSPAPH
jgi:hypothetical protein